MEQILPLVMIVDDSASNLDVLNQALKSEYRMIMLKSGVDALKIIDKKLTEKTELPEVILLDIIMPEMNGYEVCQKLKSNPATCDIPVIFITAMEETKNITRAFEVGAVDYITKPINVAEVKARAGTHLVNSRMSKELSTQKELLEVVVEERTQQLKETLEGLFNTNARLVEMMDPYTAGHQRSVSRLALAIAEKMGVTDNDMLTTIRFAGLLHDIGKPRIGPFILGRPGELFESEISTIQKHPQEGYNLVKDEINSPWPLAEVILQVHERIDGSGYPNKLEDEDILFEAKIIMVADVVEAMTSHRPYRRTPGIDKAMFEIVSNKGKLYDSGVVDACVQLIQVENWWEKNIPQAQWV